MKTSLNFPQAVADYVLLLNKKYPEKTILELVGTRYALSGNERSMLYRGVTTAEKSEKRKKRLIEKDRLKNQVLHIDMFNVLFTIAAYLRGYPVFVSNDGILRDASESHGCTDWVEHLERAADLMGKCLPELKLKKIIFYLDNPMEACRFFLEKSHLLTQNAGIDHETVIHDSPDHLIRNAKEGVLATSDSTIIERSELPVFDLPGYVINFNFEPKLFRLDDCRLGDLTI